MPDDRKVGSESFKIISFLQIKVKVYVTLGKSFQRLLGTKVVSDSHSRVQVKDNMPESSRNKDSLTGVLYQLNLGAKILTFNIFL